jgi:hypothetical protein
MQFEKTPFSIRGEAPHVAQDTTCTASATQRQKSTT